MGKNKKRKINKRYDQSLSFRFIFKDNLSPEDEEQFWNKLFDLLLEDNNIGTDRQQEPDLPKEME